MLRSPVVQKPFQTKMATSIVARVLTFTKLTVEHDGQTHGLDPENTHNGIVTFLTHSCVNGAGHFQKKKN